MNFKTRFFVCWGATGLLISVIGLFTGGVGGGGKALGMGLVFGAPVIWVLLKVTDRAGSASAGIFTGRGGAGKVGYSSETAMARNGDREGACEVLLARGNEGDMGALHALIAIASARPMLGNWTVKAAQILLRQEKLSEGDREHFTRLIKEFGS